MMGQKNLLNTLKIRLHSPIELAAKSGDFSFPKLLFLKILNLGTKENQTHRVGIKSSISVSYPINMYSKVRFKGVTGK